MSKKIQTARKILIESLRDQMEAKGITQNMIAKKKGFKQSSISRMLSAKYPPNLDNFLKLCEAADCLLFIIDKEWKDDVDRLIQSSRKSEYYISAGGSN